MASKKQEKPGSSYSAKDIYILEGLEPVRKRPGMYIGSTGVDGLHHLIWEIVDNSIDEAMAGFAKNIKIELLKDNKVTVTDDGRGIPVDIHPQTKKSALETALCTLHAGGKFGGDSYKVSGGLHGVGVSVVNALSVWMKAEIQKDGGLYVQEYKKGEPQYKVKKVGKAFGTGTKITFQPDPTIFEKIEFDQKKILDHMRQQAYLTKGLTIEIVDERGESGRQAFFYGFCFDGGLKSFARYLLGTMQPIHENYFYISKWADKIEVEVSFVYTDDIETKEMSFANNIYTPDGGTHLTGFRSALTRVLNDYAWKEGYLKGNDDNLTGDDVREGLVGAVSIKIREPQFEGQTKARLGNTEARTAVETVTAESLKEFLEKNPTDARKIIEKNLLAAKARKAAKAAKDTVLRKGAFEGLTLPGKLADCSSRDAAESELFIVEGDSAGGCFSGDTKIALVDGRNISFKNLVAEYKQGKKNFCYSIKHDGYIGIAPITNPRITKHKTEVVKVILDNSEEIICTPDHKFMTIDGNFKTAQELTVSDSLMPLYRQHSRFGKRITIKGYEMVFDTKDHRWIFTHMLSDSYNIEHNIYTETDGDHRHHKDFNKLNNNPDNIIRLTNKKHLELHRRLLKKTLHRPDVISKCRAIHQTIDYRRKISEIMSAPTMRKTLSERAKHQWENDDYKNYMTHKFLEFYQNNVNYQKKNKETLTRAQKKYWSNAGNRRKQAERVAHYFEKNPKKRIFLSMIAQKQWQNNTLREWRSKKTKEQWTPEFRIKRKRAYNETYLKKALETLRTIWEIYGRIDKKQYNELRHQRKDRNIIRFDTVRERFFNGSNTQLQEAVKNYNHKIVRIEKIRERVDVYDLEVPQAHNFALASGVFVHNSAKQGRDRRFQAILPLRGKILNVEKSRIDKMLANKEIKSLVIALGTAIAENFDITRLRYHKIVIMTDADVDGAHIRTLLLTLFYRYFQKIVEDGYLYIAQPPLYRLQKGKEVRYVYNDKERDGILKQLGDGVTIQRYKGLGEMNPTQLWETTMDPTVRFMKRITVEDAMEADRLFDILMGEVVEPRKDFIQAYATAVKNLDV